MLFDFLNFGFQASDLYKLGLRSSFPASDMSKALTNLSRWWSKGKKKDSKLENGGSLNSDDSELSSWESDKMKFPMMIGNQNMTPKSRRFSKKLHTRQEQKVDKEHDVVLVPSDGDCISDSDSDASDWSIGWSEPHGPDFESDDDIDGGFGVLVPCYGVKHRDVGESSKKGVEMNLNGADYYSTDSKNYKHEWMYSLQTS